MATSTIRLESPSEFQPIFTSLPVHQKLFFDEGPHVRPTVKTSLSGSDTSAIDAFTQGVELTNISRYDAGVVKVWSGEPGHVLPQMVYGQDKTFFLPPQYVDVDKFNPINYIKAQDKLNSLDYVYENLFTFPIVTGDNDQLETTNFNGVIEPLAVRQVVSFSSINVPIEPHAFRGVIESGNESLIKGSDRVVTVYVTNVKKQTTAFLDTGYFLSDIATLLPFVDQRLVRNTLAPSTVNESALVPALSLMTGSTDNYVRFDQRSAMCGWRYDNAMVTGTDSLSFGGMTY